MTTYTRRYCRGGRLVLVLCQPCHEAPVRPPGQCSHRVVDLRLAQIPEFGSARKIEQGLFHGRHPSGNQMGVDALEIESADVSFHEHHRANLAPQDWALLRDTDDG